MENSIQLNDDEFVVLKGTLNILVSGYEKLKPFYNDNSCMFYLNCILKKLEDFNIDRKED